MNERPELSVPAAFAALLAFQLAGETAAIAVTQSLPGVAVPGPVLGMALFLSFLFWRGGPGDGLDATASGILKHLSLLFVPAGVGVLLHVARVADEWLPIAAALVVSTVLAMAVSALVFERLARRQDAHDRGAEP